MSLAKKIGLGRLAYHCVHAPLGWAHTLWLDGGPRQRRLTTEGKLAMEQAARRLPAPPSGEGAPVVLHLLTGRRFWYQTAFCLWSFAQTSGRTVHPVLLDDGTLDEACTEPLLQLFPSTRVCCAAEIEARLDQVLPETRFPSLRVRRRGFPLLRKLIDPHAGQAGWRLQIDSDLLFFRRADHLLAWHDAPCVPLRAEDVTNAYGYPLALLNELAGRPVPERVNTGLLGLRSDEIDWERMEFWCRTLLKRGGPQYYQEQALVALLLAGRECVVPPASDYVLLPRPPEAHACRAVMHHYVAESKRWYFQNNWKRVLAAPHLNNP